MEIDLARVCRMFTRITYSSMSKRALISEKNDKFSLFKEDNFEQSVVHGCSSWTNSIEVNGEAYFLFHTNAYVGKIWYLVDSSNCFVLVGAHESDISRSVSFFEPKMHLSKDIWVVHVVNDSGSSGGCSSCLVFSLHTQEYSFHIWPLSSHLYVLLFSFPKCSFGLTKLLR